jgi:predicted dehydrogenase
MNRVVWAMIGCGNVTEVKSGPAFYKSKNSYLYAVMCRKIDSAKSYADRHKIPCYYNDVDQILSNPHINAVYIATPVKFHAPYAIKAMEAGKTVYLEKPMALNYKECLLLKESSLNTGQKLFVAYYRRSLDYFKKIKELIDCNAIGSIKSVSVSFQKAVRKEEFDTNNLPWRVIPELSGGGYFFDLACHQFDILQFLLGTVTKAEGQAENKAGLYPAEDTVQANWLFDSGIKGIGNWSFVCPHNEQKDIIVINGSNGKIEFSTFEFSPIKLITKSSVQTFDLKPPMHIQMQFIQTIINELTNRGISDADLDSAINTSKIMEEIVYGKLL